MLSYIFHRTTRLRLPVTQSVCLRLPPNISAYNCRICSHAAVCLGVCQCVSVWGMGVQGEGLPPTLAAGSSVTPAPCPALAQLWLPPAVPLLGPPCCGTMAALISACNFVQQAQEDLSSPTTSVFASHMGRCKATASSLEEALDADRAVLQKMSVLAKAEHSCGQDLISHLEAHIAAQEFSANYQLEGEEQLASAFSTFAAFSRELLTAVRSLLQSLYHNINFSLESLIKGDMKELKGEFKKPFEKACKDYESKLTKIEKEKCELAKQHGMVQSEVSWGEIAEEMEKECRTFQLNMCEYLIKVNEIKTKKGIDLLQNHIKHCSSQFNFFQECLNIMAKLKKFTENNLVPQLQSMKIRQDEAKQQLCSLQDHLKTVLQLEQKEDPGNKRAGYNMHQLQGNKQYGTDKSGTLFKKSDGLRKVWQKRKCTISNGYLTISHSMLNCPPAKLNLLTCQVKPNMNDKKKICFDLVSYNHTYRFLAEDEQDCVVWVSVLSNSKEEALNMAFSKAQGGGKSSQEELTRAIIKEVRGMPGNRECCDCSAPDPTWLSINLGILICIECSGIHREMGVHLSRTQSLSLDKLATSELLLARNIGNSGFNNILEANLPSFSLKPTVHSDMAFQKNFIISKYVRKKYAKRSPAAQCSSLPEAVKDKDIFSLLQAYAENMDLSKPVLAPLQECGETILHLAVLLSDCTSLHIVDFLVQNSGSLAKRMAEGNTPLHYYCFHNKPECVKLLLKAKANITITNEAGETALDVARRMKHPLCEELLLQARAISSPPHVHVECEWWLGQDDMYESDEDLDEKLGPMKRGSAHPQSCYQPPAAASKPEAAGAVPWGGWPDTCPPPPAAHLRSLAVLLAPSYMPPFLPQQAKPALQGAYPPFLTSSFIFAEDTRSRWSPPLPLSIKHKHTSSEPVPWVPLSSEQPSPILQPDCVIGALKATDPLCTPGSSKVGQPGPHRSLQEPNPCSGHAWDVPPLLPRRSSLNRLLLCRVCTLYDCNGDWEDELTFRACEIIVVSEKEDSNWWGRGWIEGQPHRQGVFPASFVHVLNE
ncbi:LOW QUALITY PROTEIN: arf-GAP with SH3 domain, ANK repeat and PH domain-containing protein 1-like [Aquila chrysaetos chrysaetos]|uniref:LOW QUALITY PROTEIN: arf-GAP with SH3 domain, ANK repeat and PH domain-containing protein 1-like n=1 Tax=Aquila chrysaetos chrysaetos TaxID=223781 RepID=UPI001B7D3230|nr:LOW QUALITY PROTEIN: arf-GAP with SH3 domain, ANK repeat and PH domain-containing protein 1-like [Aquila chrysaetos chrysaetos]